MFDPAIELSPRSPDARVVVSNGNDSTGGLRYIGSKTRLSSTIASLIVETARPATLVDSFSGTGSVARACLGSIGRLHVNDQLQSAAIMSVAGLLTLDHLDFSALGSYQDAIQLLNSAEPPSVPGIFEREYAPSGLSESGHLRLYFTTSNARRIDAVRQRIEQWTLEGKVGIAEKILLLGDLIVATNSAANTSGTYGCFLRKWQPNAVRPLQLTTRILARRKAHIVASAMPASSLKYPRNSAAYFDPPYTKRQYAAYYHILETLCFGDSPKVSGVTGLRPWHHLSSDFCYKRRALEAFNNLLRSCDSRHIFVSYSNEGHIKLDDLKNALTEHGQVTVTSLGAITRYAPNEPARVSGSKVQEYLIHVEA